MLVFLLGLVHEECTGACNTPGMSPPFSVCIQCTPDRKNLPEDFIKT